MKALKPNPNMTQLLRLALLVVAACAIVGARSTAQDAGIVVNADVVIAQVSPYAFGANYGPLSFVRFELFEAAENSGITFLRFPGGRWGDLNNLTPAQIDSFMQLVERMGATPSIHVRLEDGTPEAAADLVRYTNIENDYNVRYWYIGNEPNLFDDYTVADYVVQWRAIAEAMRAVDPDIVLIGPEVSQWNGTPQVDPVDAEGVDWLRGFLEANGDIVDVVAVHRYPFPASMANPVSTVDELRANTPEWGETVERLRAVVTEITGRTDLPVAITEASSHWSSAQHGEASPDSHYHAIWWADSFGRLLQDAPFIIAYYELQTPTSRGGWGLLGQYEVRPTYYVYQLYQRFGHRVVATESSVEYLAVYGALRDDGALTLIAVNRGDTELRAPMTINGFDGSVAEVRLFTGDVPAEVVDNVYLMDSVLTMPARSAALFVFEQE
ncbi:MAG: GH39 family glycosyl hydrolase [Phototrophicaceae bacterium]